MPGTIHRNALGPVHAQTEELVKVMVGVALVLDMRSRREQAYIEPEMLRILLADIAQIEAGLAEVKAVIKSQPADAPAGEARR